MYSLIKDSWKLLVGSKQIQSWAWEQEMPVGGAPDAAAHPQAKHEAVEPWLFLEAQQKHVFCSPP